jgi:hypothetical protein
MIHHHPRLDNALGQFFTYKGVSRHTGPHWMSGVKNEGDGLDLETDSLTLEKFGLSPKQYITVHNGFDSEFFSANNVATKKIDKSVSTLR